MTTLKLNPVAAGNNRFCGPSAISILTGINTDEASRLIRSVNGKRSVMGTSDRDILASLKLCGIVASRVLSKPRGKGPTLAKWFDTTRGTKIFLVTAGWHWQVVQGSQYVCGLTSEIIDITDKRVRRRSRVSDVWELSAPTGVRVPTKRIAKAKRKPTPHLAAYQKARRLAKEYDITIEKDDVSWWVFPPSWMDNKEDDEFFNDGHFCDNWGEILSMVESYAEYIKENPRS